MTPCCAGSRCQDPMNPCMSFKCYSCSRHIHSLLCSSRVFAFEGTIQHCCFDCEQDWVHTALHHPEKFQPASLGYNSPHSPRETVTACASATDTAGTAAVSPSTAATIPVTSPESGHRYPTRISCKLHEKPKELFKKAKESTRPKGTQLNRKRRNKRRKVRDNISETAESECSRGSTPTPIPSQAL